MPETERLQIIGQLTPSSLDEAEHLRGDSKSSEVLAPARDRGWKKAAYIVGNASDVTGLAM